MIATKKDTVIYRLLELNYHGANLMIKLNYDLLFKVFENERPLCKRFLRLTRSMFLSVRSILGRIFPTDRDLIRPCLIYYYVLSLILILFICLLFEI